MKITLENDGKKVIFTPNVDESDESVVSVNLKTNEGTVNFSLTKEGVKGFLNALKTYK